MMDPKDSWGHVDISEVIGSALISLGVGMIKLMQYIREKRKIRAVDIMLEPSLAVFGGMAMWALAEYGGMPDLVQAVATSVGAWGGSKTIHRLDRKYFGGSRSTDTDNAPLGKD